jgi:hypothetical protein
MSQRVRRTEPFIDGLPTPVGGASPHTPPPLDPTCATMMSMMEGMFPHFEDSMLTKMDAKMDTKFETHLQPLFMIANDVLTIKSTLSDHDNRLAALEAWPPAAASSSGLPSGRRLG